MSEDFVIRKIQELKKIKPRSEWLALNRDILLSQINPQRELTTLPLNWRDYSRVFVSLFQQRLLEPAVVMLFVLVFSISSSLVVNASFYSLPGDSLYPVKLALENAQVAITPDEERQVELKIEFAQKRVSELDKIVNQTNVNAATTQERLTAVAKEFKKNVAAVQSHISKRGDNAANVSPADREKSLRIALSISTETKELVQALNNQAQSVAAAASPAVQEIVAEAVESAQAVSQSADAALHEGQVEGASTSDQSTVDSTTTAEVVGAEPESAPTASTTESNSGADNLEIANNLTE